MGQADLVSPVSSADGDDGELGEDDGPANGGGYFLAALDSETDVTVAVSDGYEGLEPGALSGSGLFLHGHDLEHLVLQFASADEEVDDLGLFDGQREEVDLL